MNEKKLEYLIKYKCDINDIGSVNDFISVLESLAQHDIQFSSSDDFINNRNEIKLLLLKITKIMDEMSHLILLLNCLYEHYKGETES